MLAAKITNPEEDNNEKLDENCRIVEFFIKNGVFSVSAVLISLPPA